MCVEGDGTVQMEKAVSLTITVLMTIYLTFWRCRRSGAKEACVYSAGFFVVAFYLDRICMLIMEGFRESGGGNEALDWLAVLVSKSILAAALIMERAMDGRGSGGAGVRTEKYSGADKQAVAGNSDGEENRFGFFDGLSLGASLFFFLLGVGSSMAAGAVRQTGAAEQFLTAVFLFGVLLVFYASLELHKKRQLEEKKQAEVQNRKREADVYLENVENNYQRTRELWHDLKNHINLMNLLLAEKKYEQLTDYLRMFGEDVDTLTLPVKSGNLIVDALLADKAARAKKEGVEVKLSLCNLTGLALKPDEICGLLGNLLDNALEANRQVEGRKYIQIECREQEICYYIQVRNAAVRNAAGRAPEQQGGILQTTKTDRQNRVGHGLGLRSVERIAHSCGGELAVNSGEREFTAVVKIPKQGV